MSHSEHTECAYRSGFACWMRPTQGESHSISHRSTYNLLFTEAHWSWYIPRKLRGGSPSPRLSTGKTHPIITVSLMRVRFSSERPHFQCNVIRSKVQKRREGWDHWLRPTFGVASTIKYLWLRSRVQHFTLSRLSFLPSLPSSSLPLTLLIPYMSSPGERWCQENCV